MNKLPTILQGHREAEADRFDHAAVDSGAVVPRSGAAARLRGRATFAIVSGLIASFAVLVALMLRAGLAIEASSSMKLVLGAALAATTRVVAPRLRWRHARAIGDCAEFYLVFALVALMGALASYPLSALTQGYCDSTLHAIDTALGFDWQAWYRAVARSRTLQFIGTAAYRSIYLTPALLLAYFAGTGQRGEAYRFIITFWLSAVMTLVLFSFMPAVGPLSYLWHGPIVYMPESELWQPDLIPQLRAHVVHSVDLGDLRGLVSAPSFHAAAATLYAAAAWRIRSLRKPLLLLNAAMLVSTPVEGTHYLADILLGVAVASLALLIVHHGAARYRRARSC